MDLYQLYKSMPKFELHVHVEGAVSADTYFRLATDNGIKLPVETPEEWRKYFEFKDFPHFIDVYITAVSAIKKPSDYTFLVEEFYRNQQAQNILYSEAYLSASFLTGRFKDDKILDALEAGMKSGEAKYGVRVNFIPDIARNIPDSQQAVLDLIIKGMQRGLFIGIGLGGLETGYPADMFTGTYKRAAEAGLKLVAHAGEAVGPESIWLALRSLNAARIGHGIRCLDDPELVQYLRDTKTHVEVSPASNYCLKLVNEDTPHPIRKMIDQGVFCSINSDDPAMFSTDLTQQYVLLSSQGFSHEELLQLNKNALDASFLSIEEKAHYHSLLNAWRGI
jgi:adenosine deaminase